MREQLAKLEGTRVTVRASFGRYGTKKAFRGPPIRTALFREVTTLCGRPLSDHVWLVVGKTLAALGDLREGDQVTFSAVPKRYTKGYRGRRDDLDAAPIRDDYKLAWPQFFRRADADGGKECDASDAAQMSLGL